MALSKCIFCGCEQDDYKGLHLIKNDGNIVYYCSSKCRKNQLQLKREGRKQKWTTAARNFKERERKKVTAVKK